jgi:hypothetical protein
MLGTTVLATRSGGHSGFWRKKKTFGRTGLKNLLKVGKSVLKLEEIMWKSDYTQL